MTPGSNGRKSKPNFCRHKMGIWFQEEQKSLSWGCQGPKSLFSCPSLPHPALDLFSPSIDILLLDWRGWHRATKSSKLNYLLWCITHKKELLSPHCSIYNILGRFFIGLIWIECHSFVQSFWLEGYDKRGAYAQICNQGVAPQEACTVVTITWYGDWKTCWNCMEGRRSNPLKKGSW